MTTSHNGDNPRMSTITMAATAVAAIRLGGGWFAQSSTRIRPPVQTHMAVAISRPLGLTTEANVITVGVAVTARASPSKRDRDHAVANANDSPRKSDPNSPLSSRIRYTAESLCDTSEGRPTMA